MRILTSLAGICLTTLVVLAQPEQLENMELNPREKALEQLFSECESKESFEQYFLQARELGVTEQTLLEARFLFHVDRSEDSEIAALLPAVLACKDKFNLSDSAIFASVDDWLAVTEYVQAIAALSKGQKAEFKQHITEAFWLSPKQAVAFAPHIDRIRLMEAMKETRIDFSKDFTDIVEKKILKLCELLGDRQAMVFHFWSPWSDESKATMGDFLTTASYLTEQNLAVVSILPETDKKVVNDAFAVINAATADKKNGAWLVDTAANSLSDKLKIQTVPTFVLIAKDGEILFNGHPSSEEFWKSLRKIDSKIERPKDR